MPINRIKGYPEGRFGNNGAFYVLTQADSSLENGKVLEPGPGIAITVIGDEVIIENTGSGGGGSSLSTYITRNDETGNLPNSYRLVNGPGVNIVYGTNTVTFSAVANTQSFLTALNESSTLTGSRQIVFQPPLDINDGGAGNQYVVSLLTGQEYQVLGTASSASTYMYGADLGYEEWIGSGIVTLSASSPSVNTFRCTTGTFNVYLPPASTCLNKTFIIKKMDLNESNPIVLITDGADLIDDGLLTQINAPYMSVSLRSIGSGFILT